MFLLGLLLLILGFVLGIQILWVIGIVLIVLGLVAGVGGYVGHPVGGRRHWF